MMNNYVKISNSRLFQHKNYELARAENYLVIASVVPAPVD